MLPSGIGTLAEKSLHAALKTWYARPGDEMEVKVDRYIIDIKRGDLLIEIQTRNFAAIRRKLEVLATNHPVRLVHPISAERYIVKIAANGTMTRRKSPLRGTIYHVFNELVRIPHLIMNPRFTLEVLLVREEQTQHEDGQGSWRRKGWSIADRQLLDVAQSTVFETPADILRLLPPGLSGEFTTGDIAKGLKLPRPIAQRMAYCLRGMGMLEKCGKRGRAHSYRII